MFIRSANESAFIFRITLPRCAFTVISLMPSSPPACLFSKPATTNVITFAFAPSERQIIRPQCLQFGLATERDLAAPDCMPDGIQQHVWIEGLSEEFQSFGLHGFDRHGEISMTGEKDERHGAAFGSEALLEFETIEVWKGHVKDQTARNR